MKQSLAKLSLPSKLIVSKKYPFISEFVESMNHINAQEHVLSDLDTKSLVYFFQLYAQICRILKNNNQELSIDNITNYMNYCFEHRSKFNDLLLQ